jgi:hypothetical protein
MTVRHPEARKEAEMLTRKYAAIATAALLVSIPAGAALAVDDDTVADDPVVTCSQDQVQAREQLQLHDPVAAGDMTQERTTSRQRLQLQAAECDGTGQQLRAGYGTAQGNGPGAGEGIRARAQDGDCDGTGPGGRMATGGNGSGYGGGA